MKATGAGRATTALALGVAALGFGANAAWLASEGRRLGGQAGRAEQAVGATAVGLALLCAVACVRWALARRPWALRPRLGLGAYVGVLATVFALALTGGHLWSGQGRPALGAFAALLACTLLVFGFSLVPWLLLDERGILDALGRRLAPASLERSGLLPVPGAPGRHRLLLWTKDAREPLALQLVEVDTHALSARLEALGIPPGASR